MEDVLEILQVKNAEYKLRKKKLLIELFVTNCVVFMCVPKLNLAERFLFIVIMGAVLYALKAWINADVDFLSARVQSALKQYLLDKECYNLDTMTDKIFEKLSSARSVYKAEDIKKAFSEEYERYKGFYFKFTLINFNVFPDTDAEKEKMFNDEFKDIDSYLNFKRPNIITPVFTDVGTFSMSIVTKDYSDLKEKL